MDVIRNGKIVARRQLCVNLGANKKKLLIRSLFSRSVIYHTFSKVLRLGLEVSKK